MANEISSTVPLIVTSIYSEFWGTKQFKRSLDRLGLTFYNAHKGSFKGNGNVMRLIYEGYLDHKDSHDYAVYMDGADCFVVRPFRVDPDNVVFSAEKACWPIADLAKEYPECESPWKYLNAGTCSGPIPLLIEFYEKYGLHKYTEIEVTGQLELHKAYLQALKDGFPIKLDTNCDNFQTTAFGDPGDFFVNYDTIVNRITRTYPAVFHGNGRTPLDWIYNLYK